VGVAKSEADTGGRAKKEMSVEEAQVLRRRHGIKVTGGTGLAETPGPFETFDDLPSLGVPSWLVENLRTTCKYSNPTAVQMQAVPAILKGHSVLASAPTGSGKTVAFLLPILTALKGPGKDFCRALVVCPTRELAVQTLREFERLSMGKKFKGRMLDKALEGSSATSSAALQKTRLDFGVSTPLKLVQKLREGGVSLKACRHLVLDEADKLLDLGFQEQVDEIIAACAGPSVALHFFSATLPENVIRLAESVVTSPLRIMVGAANAASLDVDQKLLFVSTEEGKLMAFRQMVQQGEVAPPCLVFVQSKERAQELFAELLYDGVFVDVMSAEKTRAQRDTLVEAFRTGKVWVLICTDLMARGVDFKGVQLVVNYDMPQSAATYIHRVGRTGRAGRKGRAVTFFTAADIPSLRPLVNVLRQSGLEVPQWMAQIKKMERREQRKKEWRPPDRRRISTDPDAPSRRQGKGEKGKRKRSEPGQDDGEEEQREGSSSKKQQRKGIPISSDRVGKSFSQGGGKKKKKGKGAFHSEAHSTKKGLETRKNRQKGLSKG